MSEDVESRSLSDLLATMRCLEICAGDRFEEGVTAFRFEFSTRHLAPASFSSTERDEKEIFKGLPSYLSLRTRILYSQHAELLNDIISFPVAFHLSSIVKQSTSVFILRPVAAADLKIPQESGGPTSKQEESLKNSWKYHPSHV